MSFSVFVAFFNLFAAAINAYFFAKTQNPLNVFCFVISFGIFLLILNSVLKP